MPETADQRPDIEQTAEETARTKKNPGSRNARNLSRIADALEEIAEAIQEHLHPSTPC